MPAEAQELVSRLGSDVRLAVVVGYSGSDFFDVDVAFANLAPAG